MAPSLGGIKQKKLIIHPLASLIFLLLYSPKPRSHVRILIYRKWSIEDAKRWLKIKILEAVLGDLSKKSNPV